ncbi:hypothetical protein G7046_g7112 [Stylonectria norvegica]|nr:hypothetical protein G7046_g7112 [Stylonectria norvegica]
MYSANSDEFKRLIKPYIQNAPLMAVREGVDAPEVVEDAKTSGGRPGEADEVAGVVAMLCGPESAWCTGQVICANGGMIFGMHAERKTPKVAMAAVSDPFEDVLNLEANFYRDGYQQGLRDGIAAGRIEGRTFGMEKGFEKFLESGRLASKAIVWANQAPLAAAAGHCALPALPHNTRLQKNISTLYALVEPETLSTANSDEAVQDFDDRVKRALGKAKVIEKTGRSGTKDGAKDSPRDAIKDDPAMQ